MTYSVFLVELFTLAAGLSILETSAHPFVISMGPEANSTRPHLRLTRGKTYGRTLALS
jgi:fucose permease